MVRQRRWIVYSLKLILMLGVLPILWPLGQKTECCKACSMEHNHLKYIPNIQLLATVGSNPAFWRQNMVLSRAGKLSKRAGWKLLLKIQHTEAHISAQIATLADQDQIHSAISVPNSLNPADEAMEDQDTWRTKIQKYLIRWWRRVQKETGQERLTRIPWRLPQLDNRRQWPQYSLLQRYEQQQDDGDNAVLSQLVQLEISM
jgi:hypothetical protein